MKCRRCGREISDKESYAHQGRVFCEDCLMEVGLHAAQCQPWATYLAGKERAGMTGTEGLTALQQKVYILVRDQGKITREDVKRNLNLSKVELDAQLTPLMHAELVKERGEAGSLYRVAVS
jgi:hypothetical protein